MDLESVVFGRDVLSKSNALGAFPARIIGTGPLIMILVQRKYLINATIIQINRGVV